jgi:hypothetical protein
MAPLEHLYSFRQNWSNPNLLMISHWSEEKPPPGSMYPGLLQASVFTTAATIRTTGYPRFISIAAKQVSNAHRPTLRTNCIIQWILNIIPPLSKVMMMSKSQAKVFAPSTSRVLRTNLCYGSHVPSAPLDTTF